MHSDGDYLPTNAEQERVRIDAAIRLGRDVATDVLGVEEGRNTEFIDFPEPLVNPIIQGPAIPFRTAYKLDDIQRLGHASLQDIAKVHRIPRYIPKKQKSYMYYHVHGFNTWMIDIVFIKTDGTVFELSEADATVLAEAQRIEEVIPQPEGEGEGEDEEGEGEGEEGEGEGEEGEVLEQIPDEIRRQFADATDRILRENNCKIVLLCIHCNSRKSIAFVIKNQKALTLIPCLAFLCYRYHCDTIISDAQASIGKAIYDINHRSMLNVKHIKLNMSSKNNQYFHTMLSLVDRMCRTLRDMIYNVKFHNQLVEVDNILLFKLCDIYNNVQHDRLTMIMGFPITPQQMFENLRVQQEFIRRLSAHNYRLNHINRMIPEKEIVRIYNRPEPFKKRRNSVADDEYEVEGYDGRYFLRNLKTGTLGRYLRSQIVRY